MRGKLNSVPHVHACVLLVSREFLCFPAAQPQMYMCLLAAGCNTLKCIRLQAQLKKSYPVYLHSRRAIVFLDLFLVGYNKQHCLPLLACFDRPVNDAEFLTKSYDPFPPDNDED